MIITDEEIEKAFKGTNFGSVDTVEKQRLYLAQDCLKFQAGYRSGSAITLIMIRLDLIGVQIGHLTKKGKMFLYEEFKQEIV